MSIELTNLQQQTLEKVKEHYRDNPITGAHLAEEINLEPRSTGKEGADMRSIINALRTKGHPVCANGKGYFWPRNVEELSKYIDEFQNRINDQIKALEGLRAIALKASSKSEEISDKDLDAKLRQLLQSSHLSFNEEDKKRIDDLSAALKSNMTFLKRNAIKKYA